MAKVGINAFLLDCRTNENISEIEAEYGVKGFAVVVRLWQKIYSEKGYYCEWSGRSPLLFLSDWFGGNSGVTCSLINEIVDRCLNNGIFNAEMYEKYSILTSARMQTQYFDVVKRREEILVQKEYLLVSVDKIKGIAYKNDVSVCRNQKNVCRNDISKGKVSKANNKNNMCKADALALFERLWKLYPSKKGKGRVSDTQKVKLLKIGYEEMSRAIERYERYVESVDYLQWQNGGTFFNSGYIDYLDANYTEQKQKKIKNSFNDFPQREYDFDDLERQILNSNPGGG
ncbi:DUF4373 domain-containing protein [Lachnospiraceae bacterium]|nr:DUF4373 domain-containing protein [Lachnospiraceae bacterium]